MQAAETLSKWDKFSLLFQRTLSWVFLFVVYFGFWFAMVFIRKWTVGNKKLIRAKLHKIAAESKGPLVICANHFTYVDSLILIWAFGSPWYYLFNFTHFPWNLPNKENFDKNWYMRLSVYLGKCVPVTQGAPREETKKTMAEISYLLGLGDDVMIFPEGRRSLTQRVDDGNIGYGVGELVQSRPDITVVCVYLRGNSQKEKSYLAKRGENFYLDITTMTPTTRKPGRRNAREITHQIMGTLVALENTYFATDHKTWE